MKKCILSILITAGLIFSSAFADGPEYRVKINDKVEIGTSRAFECAAVIAHLAGFPEYNMEKSHSHEYAAYFVQFNKDEKVQIAIRYFKKLHNTGFGYDAVANIATYLNSDCHSYRTSIDIVEANIQKRCGDPEKFLEVISDFYDATKFDDFYQSMNSVYQASTSALLANKDIIIKGIEEYEKYYRTEINGIFISASPIVGPSNYGVSFNDGSREYFEPKYCANYFDENLLIHELSHPMSNPVVYEICKNKKIMKLVNKDLKGEKKKILQSQAYNNAETYLIELFNRANTNNILKGFCTEEYIKTYIEYDKNKCRFDEIAEVTELLDKYRNGNYKNLEEFRPELEKGFLKILNNKK